MTSSSITLQLPIKPALLNDARRMAKLKAFLTHPPENGSYILDLSRLKAGERVRATLYFKDVLGRQVKIGSRSKT